MNWAFQTFSCLILIVCSGGDWVLCAKESSGIKTSYLISSGIPYSCFLIRTCGHRVSASCFSESIFVKKHISEICLVGFVIYFWVFSFSVGFYKPQFKKEYEMMNYNDGWYYVLARYDTTLVLSKSFKSGNGRFLVIRSEQLKIMNLIWFGLTCRLLFCFLSARFDVTLMEPGWHVFSARQQRFKCSAYFHGRRSPNNPVTHRSPSR